MPTADEYIMSEAVGDLELARLRANEAWMDEHTKAQLDGTGIGPGWRSLEVAAGAGSIVRWLAERVGSTGGVTAVDINTRFLTDLPDNVTILEHDITGGRPRQPRTTSCTRAACWHTCPSPRRSSRTFIPPCGRVAGS